MENNGKKPTKDEAYEIMVDAIKPGLSLEEKKKAAKKIRKGLKVYFAVVIVLFVIAGIILGCIFGIPYIKEKILQKKAEIAENNKYESTIELTIDNCNELLNTEAYNNGSKESKYSWPWMWSSDIQACYTPYLGINISSAEELNAFENATVKLGVSYVLTSYKQVSYEDIKYEEFEVELDSTGKGKAVIYESKNDTGFFYYSDPTLYVTSIVSVKIIEVKGNVKLACVHNWTDGDIITEPTCVAIGTKKLVCSKCKKEKEASVEALGHSYDEEEASIIPATCTENGRRVFTCIRCGESIDEVIEKLGHSFDDYVTTPATCTEDGYKTSQCSRCEVEDTIILENSKLGHNYGDDGICTRCGELNPDVKVRSLEINNESFIVEKDSPIKVVFSTYPENAIYKSVVYRIIQNNTCDATLTDEGILTCTQVGSVTVTVTLDNEITARATFYVPQIISTAEEFNDIRENLTGVYMLSNDIDLSEFTEWIPIGFATKNISGNYDYTNAFGGKFYGNGYKIEGVNINVANNNCKSLLTVGLFGSLSRDGVIDNVEVTGVRISGSCATTDYIGGITAFNPGSVSNCKVTDPIINVSGAAYVGSAIGENIGSVSKITVTNASITITGDKQYNIGGAVGRSNGGQIATVRTNGTISVTTSGEVKVGGVCGDLIDKITDTESDIIIEVVTTGSSGSGSDYIGGIAGTATQLLNNITVSGTMTVNSNHTIYAGGIAGYGVDFENDENNIGISITSNYGSSAYIGGIAGYSKKIIKCGNQASISFNNKNNTSSISAIYVGGVTGYCDSASESCNGITAQITTSYSNTGSSYYTYIGGVAGYIKGSANKLTNEANLQISTTSLLYCGGVVGLCSDNASNIINNGKTINITSSFSANNSYSYVGGCVAKSSTINNISNASDLQVNVSSMLYCGGVVGSCGGSSSGAINNGKKLVADSSISNSSSYSYNRHYIGGVLGNIEGELNPSTNYATISSTVNSDVYLGGIAGYSSTSKEIKDVNNYAYSITLTNTTSGSNSSYIGGIIGNASATINKAYNTAFLNIRKESVYVGGIVGSTSGGVKESVFTADITVNNSSGNENKYSYIGGIAGSTSSTISGSSMSGEKISVNSNNILYVGGIVGSISSTVSESVSSADISSSTYYNNYVGGIAGNGNVISKSYSTGNLFATSTNSNNSTVYIGGIIGYLNNSISESYSYCDVKGLSPSYAYVGGLAGYAANNTRITDSYVANSYVKTDTSAYSTSASVTVYNGVLVAYNAGVITNCYSVGYNYSISTGSTNSHSHYIGGLVGYNTGTINSSYVLDATDKIARIGLEITRNVVGSGAAAKYYAGGFAGYNSGTIQNVYSFAKVNTTVSGAYTGGFVGYNNGTVKYAISYGEVNSGISGETTGGFSGGGSSGFTSCFFSEETSLQSTGTGNTSASGIASKSNTLLRKATTYSNFGTSIWNIIDGTYPTLIFDDVWENRTDGFNKYDMLLNVIYKERQYIFTQDDYVTVSFVTNTEPTVPARKVRKGSIITLITLSDYTSGSAESQATGNAGANVARSNKYDFVGWYADEECNTAVDSIYKVTEDVTLYAFYQLEIKMPLPAQFVYSGTEYDVSETYVTTEYCVVDGMMTGTKAGTYKIIFTLEKGFIWQDGSSDVKTMEWAIIPQAVDIPNIYDAVEMYLFFTGEERDLATEFAHDLYSVSGDTTIKQLDDKKHSIAFTLKDNKNYYWSDKDTEAKIFEYYIVTGACNTSDSTAAYQLKDGVLTIKGTGAMRDYSSTNQPWYTAKNEITKIVIGDDITYIGGYSFYDYCSVSEVVIGKNVISIGYGAFYYCNSLTSIIIPDTVTTISNDSFRRCSNLLSITIGENVSSIGNNAFYECYKLVEVYNKSVLNLVIGNTSYGYVAYYAKDLCTEEYNTKISTTTEGYILYTDEEKVILMGYAGTDAQLVIPDNITEVYQFALNGCSFLESITVPFIGNCNGLTSTDTYQYPFGFIFGTNNYSGGTAVTQYYYNSSISKTTNTTYYIPSSLQSVTVSGGNIPYGAFYNCCGFTSITIPNDVTSIGDYAFYNCTGLTEITIPDSATCIGDSAFYNCSGLTNIIISDKIVSIGDNAFNNCSGLMSISVPSEINKIGNNAFNGCDHLHYSQYDNGYYLGNDSCPYIVLIKVISKDISSVEIASTTTVIYSSAFLNCVGLTVVSIPNKVVYIGSSAFNGCDNLAGIYYEGDLESWFKIEFDSNPLYYAHNLYINNNLLTDIVIPTGIKEIKKGAFKGWNGTRIIIPESVISIGDSAFSYCYNIEEIIIPNKVVEIGNSVFFECSGLARINIPTSVESIGNAAFCGCSSLASITIPNGVTSIGSSAFQGCSSLTSITIPNGVASIGDNTFNGCSHLTSINIPYSVKSIGSSAFRNCSKLTSVGIGGGVESIYNAAFLGCSSLTYVYIPRGVSYIGTDVFNFCTNLTGVSFENQNGWYVMGDPVYVGNSSNNVTMFKTKHSAWVRR